MKVLGLSAHFHDASAALIVDGRLVAAVAEERFSRIRHDAAFPRHAAAFCLKQAGITAEALDAVVFYEEPHQKFTRVMATTLGGFPRTLGPFVRAMKGWLSHKLFVRGGISRELDVHPDVVHMVPHHLSHAAYAFEASGCDEAAILVVDAVGEWASTSLGRAKRGQGIEILETYDYPNSIGLFYAAMTAFFGFEPNADECTTMALAAFGKPSRVEDLQAVLRLESDGTYSLDPGYFDFLADDGRIFTSRFVRGFGQPANAGLFASLDAMAETTLSAEQQRYADLAASVQALTELAVLGLARRLASRVPLPDLCISGGVALNCVANGKLAAEGIFTRVHCPPDPGDGGGSVGAAILGAQPTLSSPITGLASPYVGAPTDLDAVEATMAHIENDAWQRVGPGAPATRNPARVRFERHASDAALIDDCVRRLSGGEIVGWVQGRGEVGPRALGARSLLLDPSRVDRARVMSSAVKRRSSLRPYALTVAEEHRERVFERPPHAPLERWMQTSAPIREAERHGLRAGVHIDGTTRPQVLRRDDNPRFHALLTAFGVATGRASALLNTSLNERGEPIAGSALDALAMFARTDMDALVVDELVIWKEW
ncbi:MAG: carbamoyl transferase [Myxococcales bacterium]|nr:carbamoyl transferase [Myxococcales bacterium]